MKRFLKISVVFTIVAMMGYFVLVFVTRSFFPSNYAYLVNVPYVPSGQGHLKARIDDIQQFSDIDILVIGSSHAYRGFDPRLFEAHGYSMFNLGSSAQSPIQSYYFLQKYIDQLNPKLVIIEVFPKTFSSDGIESGVDLISNCPMDIQLTEMALGFTNIKPFNSLLYRIADQGVLNHTYPQEHNAGLDHYVSGGYVERQAGNQKSYTIPDSISLKLDKKQLKAFEKTINLLKNKNISFVLVQAPVTKELYHSFRETEPFNKLMSSYGMYYNFNEIELLQDSVLFYDSDHLNQRGTEKFNKILFDTLSDEIP